MPIPYLVSSLLASILATLSILRQTYLWQRKEYRWDRMRSYLTSPEGSPTQDIFFLLFAAGVFAGWVTYISGFTELPDYFGFAALILLALKYAYEAMVTGIYRPHITPKAGILLLLLAAVVIGLLLMVVRSPLYPALQLSTLLFFLPAAAAVCVLFANAVAGIRKRSIIAEASRLRDSRQQMKVVGITGSFGKTSTKEFLYQILKQAGLNVRATRAHRNSEFAVAQDMIEQLRKEPEIYIAEMAAYRRGEIAALVQLTRPRIGVVTAISNQHAALFGSTAALAAAKWELIKGLPSEGVAVVNKDDERIRTRSKTAKVPVVAYSMKTRADVYAEDISLSPQSISALLHIGENQQRITLPLAGRAALNSALAAAATASALNVPAKNIFAALRRLKPLSRTMHIVPGLRGSVVIDDSYSGGEAAALNALEQLKAFDAEDKRIVFVPIIELGREGKGVHRRLGQALAASGASVLIFGKAHEHDIRQGMGKKQKNALWFTRSEELTTTVTASVGSGTVTLFEGRVPEVVRNALIR
ncbi:MAG: UDP-N-acetylmuramoyl-tripeptide--D-alanyl-D-alanine ligase [Candidatus Andersenbacteria bacterium]|nr:UDP-N-acetylmuramoyl-tripeptide--D-alanyl-D-alanine ligase [Candidatus Andersenbacteria bacterium]MBI3250299.1 UDP-N-acetylmuramoyl-tripeptide--D-alanyl-D-alanine ligase [Candidatus Andersenbacteria bacterium]